MNRKKLPKELRDEEGIPEALEKLEEANSTPWLMELLRHREKLLVEEDRRLDRVRCDERAKAFMETVNTVLRIMKDGGYDRALIERIRRKARRRKAAMISGAGG